MKNTFFLINTFFFLFKRLVTLFFSKKLATLIMYVCLSVKERTSELTGLNSWWIDLAHYFFSMLSFQLFAGEKLIQGTKYKMIEVVLNDYSLLMNLTIRALHKGDFGGYICSSQNFLGKDQGLIRLQGNHLNYIVCERWSSNSQFDLEQSKSFGHYCFYGLGIYFEYY